MSLSLYEMKITNDIRQDRSRRKKIKNNINKFKKKSQTRIKKLF